MNQNSPDLKGIETQLLYDTSWRLRNQNSPDLKGIETNSLDLNIRMIYGTKTALI